MTIEWMSFLRVVLVSLFSAALLVTLFSLALRLNEAQAGWRRAAAKALFVLCGLGVAFGIYLIIPISH